MARGSSWKGARVFTVGHSTRTLEELRELLRSFDIAYLADVRTIPRSRHNPQFSGDSLASALRSRPRYVQLPELGGLRRARKDSINTAWRNASFRGYADYMQTEDFESGLTKLHALSAKGLVAVMCAEAVPWRCHRSLIADALTARGAHVEDLSRVGHSSPHRMTAFASVKGGRVTYPGEDPAGMPLATEAPFNLEATVRVLQRRPTNLVDVWEEERYRRVVSTTEGLALVEVSNRGTVDVPDVRLVILHGSRSTRSRRLLEENVRKVLGLDVDPAPLQALAEAERPLQPTALALRGMRPPRFAALFEAVTNVIPFQQVSLDAGVAIVGRLVTRFGESLEHEGRSFHVFPTAQVVAEAPVGKLKECGLSLRKAETLQRLAQAMESGELSEAKLARMSSDEALGFLTELKGIGPWSASLILLRGMRRLDVFPPGDVGAERGLSTLLRIKAGASLDRVIQRFGEHRGYLYFCSLGGSLLAKGLIHSAPLK